MKGISKPAKMPRLFGAMFATAAVAACALAGTAFADDGYKADRVGGFYDDSYALMETTLVKGGYDSDAGKYIESEYQYDLIDTNYKVLLSYKSTDTNKPIVTDYGVLVTDEDTGKYGLNTYTGKTLLDKKYDKIAYGGDSSQTVFAAALAKDKLTLEQYARGTTKAIDTLEIDAKVPEDASHYISLSVNDAFVIVSAEYWDSEAGEYKTAAEKTVYYTEEGLTVKDLAAPEGFEFDGSTDAVTDGVEPVFYKARVTKDADDEEEYVYYLPDGTLLPELTGYVLEESNFADGQPATKWLFVKTDNADDGSKVTDTAKLVDADGNTIVTLPEQSMSTTKEYGGGFSWGIFADYVYVTGSYYTPVDPESETNYNTYVTYLPAKFFDESGNVAKEIANVRNASDDIAAKDKTKYAVVSAYAVFNEDVKGSYDSDTEKSRYTGSYSAYYDESLNEIPGHTITSQNQEANLDEPQYYMLDGTKLYTAASGSYYGSDDSKFAFDQDGNFVQRAGQYISGVYANVSNIRVGSTDAFIATTDNGKFGVVASDGTELAASEYEKIYTKYNCNLAMVKKADMWYFIDLAGKARAEMYRLYNSFTGEHFYTASASERDNVVAAGWNDEGTGWIAPGGSNKPVFRLYNEFGGEHHYTTSATERDELVAAGWSDEGVGWFSDTSYDVALYREYNPYMFSCNHNYTADKDEHNTLVEAGWVNEGTAWYGVDFVAPMGDGAETAATTEAAAESSDLTAAAL